MKALKIISGLFALLFLASSAMAVGIAPFISIPALMLGASLSITNPAVHTAEVTSDVTALTSYSGTFAKKLIRTALNGLDIAKDINVIRNLKSNHQLPKFVAADGIRPLNTNVEERGGNERAFSDRTIEMKGGMKIFTIIPENLRNTYISEMLDENAKEIPFAQFVWEGEFEKLQDEINENAYLGVHNADADAWASGSTYSATDFVNFTESIYEANTSTLAGESPTTHPAKWDLRNSSSITTGLGTVLATEITAANITPVTTGAITSSNAYASVQAVYRNLPVAVRNKKSNKVTIYLSTDTWEKYLDNVETLFGNGNIEELPESKGDVVYLRKSSRKAVIKPATWMGTSSRIIATPRKNLNMGTNLLEAVNSIGETVKTLHGYKAICKWLLGFQIADLNAISVNEQA